MNKFVLTTGSILGILGIIIGAFAAHGLEKLIDTEAQQTFETGVRYQMYHALFLLAVGMMPKITHKAKKQIGILVVLGILFFSGSIYGLATNNLSAFDFKIIGFITPIGGLLLILAWLFFLIKILKMKQD
ncbi:DUF423 domain-containing protein [Winogradskyella maritima]|uniref:DUF423 domain-containing protein n=1 Tax=Winogradskyella maritima TaxID=1517766 RepID=A0ABV8AFU0_9FLAO|nr:DUF423 domain-containing protein [Winogradskyella maritima]